MVSPSLEDLARRAANAVDPDAVVTLTRALVRVDSVYRPGVAGSDESKVAAVLADALRARGLRVRIEEAAAGRPNVIADWSTGRDGRGLILEGHTDVVTEGDAAAWTHPPFAATLRDGRIIGRGANDMKGGLAAAVAALDAVRAIAGAPESGRLRGRIRLAAVCDEEGLMTGIKAFVRGGGAAGFDGAIVCEPEENEVCLHQKGAMRVVAVFRGRMAHGAMPYAGVNPIPWVARFIDAVAALNETTQARYGAHAVLGKPWITPTTVRAPAQGEAQSNVMAGDARVTVDVRTIPGQDHAEILKALRDAADGVRRVDPRADITLEVADDRPWTETPPDHPLARAAARAQTMILGGEPRYGGVPGTTDGTILRAWAGIPIVTMGPGRRDVPHQVNEYVDVEELVDAARIYAAAIVLFLGEDE